jgi:proline racemase
MPFAPLVRAADWTPPERWLRITTVDAHTGGEPFRVVCDGFPPLEGDTILARRRYARDTLDHLRTAIMWEPRGHADMYGCLVTPPVTPGAHAGVLFLHNEGYSTMCGHGVIAFVTVALETGMFPREEPETVLRIDTPAGLVTARALVSGGRVRRVAFRNVPAFVAELDAEVDVPGVGRVRYDLAFGGAFYAYVECAGLGVRCFPADYGALRALGMRIKRAVVEARAVIHPLEDDLGFLYGTIFTGPPEDPAHHSRNVCIFAEGEVDRSPTGTGVSGRVALLIARGEIGLGDEIVVESILGTTFTGRGVERTRVGPHHAVIPEIEGSAHVTGRHEFLIDPDDPLRDGFFLR